MNRFSWGTRLLIAASLSLAGLSMPVTGIAQAWPTKPVKLVVPFPAGGATDTVARVLAQTMQADLGQAVIVENRAGAAGAIGSSLVEKSAPDGYTLLLATSSTHSIAPHLVAKLTYDPINGFTPISLMAEGASLLVLSPSQPFTNVTALVEYAKANPKKLNYGSSGIGSIPHLNAAYFAGSAGIELQHIPYTGSSLAYPDLKAGRIDLMVDAIVSALPQVRGGTVRALAITSTRRSSLAPEIPTLAESGLPNFQSTVWFGLFGPKGMTPATIQEVSRATVKALQSAELKSRFLELGVEATPSDPAEFTRILERESEKWKKVITDFGVKAE